MGLLNKWERPVCLGTLAHSPSDNIPAEFYVYVPVMKSVILHVSGQAHVRKSWPGGDTLQTSLWIQVVGQSVHRRQGPLLHACTRLEILILKKSLLTGNHDTAGK